MRMRIQPLVVPTLAGMLAFAALPTRAAEAVRLRPTASVYVDASGTGMSGPQGVDFDGSGRLAVADTGNGRILLYSVDGRRIVSTGEVRLSEVRSPVRVRIDSHGGLLLLDSRSHRIVRAGPDGAFGGFVELPESDGADALPRSFDLDPNDNLYVLAAGTGRILVLGPDGALQREIPYGPEARSLADLAVANDGTAFAVDAVGRRVFVAHPGDPELRPLTGPMEKDMTFPTGIAADTEGNLYLADNHGGGIVIVGQDGSYRGRESATGWRDGFLRYPDGLSAGADLLFVADRGNNRVQVFTLVR